VGFVGQNRGSGDAILPPNEFVIPFRGGGYVCANFGENRSRNTTRKSARRRTDWQTDRLTDANRFYNLSHATLYAMGQIINVKIAMCQFVSKFSAMFLPNIIWNGLQLEKFSQKNKKCKLLLRHSVKVQCNRPNACVNMPIQCIAKMHNILCLAIRSYYFSLCFF